MGVVFKSYEIVVIRVFLHANPMNSFLHQELCQNLWILRNMQKMEEYYLLTLFSIF